MTFWAYLDHRPFGGWCLIAICFVVAMLALDALVNRR